VSTFSVTSEFEGGHPVLYHQLYITVSTVNTQHIQRPDVTLQLGYTRRRVSAVKRPSSGQYRIVLLRKSKKFVQWDLIVYKLETWWSS